MQVFYQDLTRKVPIEHVHDASFTPILISCAKCSLYNRRVKRVLDLALSLACIMLSLPIALFVAIAIKLEPRGPLFFWQERVGWGAT
ncbi:hypothetical protein HKBW3S03_01665 [Candidatus Hakubella thermalkaliphila]|uniref:Bacterial sugar transferase domain-containing protein n=2 Tax=Candidatus Hakubella thermalkaliphila TaxID=2754717 RepID=A0A6V8Q6Z0_9ACTN|nr:hypothetical protein HKBW3S03_01665 [Candidatus Hakubella thermalkaliphila]GFP23422.1 hypothetical protein HKBW3S09_00889 [Candidatus Hakubella thermalkaliphila]GFP30149.1 hypothetical protein HKBW3S34_01069 [Candidatus Hakubella thermalkaliphila]GFP40512.1 hypothetical protein HKBW3S47_02209 [Candidatus Hakubella thermalkaliphila]